MKNKVAKIIFSVILLGAIIVPSVGGISTGANSGIFTPQGVDNPGAGL
jgi:hypothetical protein